MIDETIKKNIFDKKKEDFGSLDGDLDGRIQASSFTHFWRIDKIDETTKIIGFSRIFGRSCFQSHEQNRKYFNLQSKSHLQRQLRSWWKKIGL